MREELNNNTYLNKQEYEWLIEAMHNHNLTRFPEDYNERIYKLVVKLQRDREAFQYCTKCRTEWIKHWSDETHACNEEEQ
jgi:hypothetical protein